ncbi:unnamed protein product [Acanthoscelides obtectus]|uniref:Uncharacterized protein n=1 Tax=Acanthoscelides obtectus TaxID=200917 RepID=A0A9P0PWA3_ACAOB|nr:unnamed protein product [Acanthoscelides obtectus]CAK1671557.1 hypothetical protein AOBTE_LOCUS28315 [Acanthoscelides obtectus]
MPLVSLFVGCVPPRFLSSPEINPVMINHLVLSLLSSCVSCEYGLSLWMLPFFFVFGPFNTFIFCICVEKFDITTLLQLQN